MWVHTFGIRCGNTIFYTTLTNSLSFIVTRTLLNNFIKLSSYIVKKYQYNVIMFGLGNWRREIKSTLVLPQNFSLLSGQYSVNGSDM